MSAPMPARDRRALQLGAALLAPMLVWVLAISPFLTALRDTREQLDAEQALLRRELEMLALTDAYPDAFRESIAALARVQPRLLGAGNAGAAGAVLTSYVQTRARQTDVLISRFEPLAADSTAPLESVTVKISGESDLRGLLAFLRSLEGGPLLLHVEGLRISRTRGGSRPAPRAGPQYAAVVSAGPETIAFECQVRGFARATTAALEPSREGA